MPQSDLEIIKDCQKGNSEAFGLLYEKYINKIYNFIYYKTFSRENTEDLVSKTFFKALRNLEDFKGENFSAWLYRIARNNVIDHYRTQKKDISLEEIWEMSDDINREDNFDTKEKLEEVKKIIKDMKANQKEIILMRVWDGLSYREIADILGKSEASCKMMFCRATRELKDQMPLLIILLLSLKI